MHTLEPAAATPCPDIDLRLALRHFGDPQLTADVLRSFVRNSGQQLQEARMALAEGDAAQAECKAHGVKGVAGFVQAARLQKLCEQAEQAIHQGDIELAKTLVRAALEAFEKARHCVLEQAPQLGLQVGDDMN
jgi:HPt (histidine-containing phosphotransfer) domain-containing protein